MWCRCKQRILNRITKSFFLKKKRVTKRHLRSCSAALRSRKPSLSQSKAEGSSLGQRVAEEAMPQAFLLSRTPFQKIPFHHWGCSCGRPSKKTSPSTPPLPPQHSKNDGDVQGSEKIKRKRTKMIKVEINKCNF